MQKCITVICGSTSTGKSDYVMSLAQKSQPALIISADSRQFYKDIPIISGQDSIENLPAGVTLVGQGFLDSDKPFSISQFQKYFYEQVQKFPEHNIFVVGGSGLYLKAISQNIETATVPQNESLRHRLDKLPLGELQGELKKINLAKFNLLNNSDVNNPRRLVRAIEIALYSQGTHIFPDLTQNPETIKFSWIGLKTNSDLLKQKIKQRTQQRLKKGAIEETKNLLKKYPNLSLPIYTTLGISEIIDFLNNKITSEELLEKWTNADLNYAKRQMVWFKKQPQIVWYDKGI